jgi:hypothetical protein
MMMMMDDDDDSSFVFYAAVTMGYCILGILNVFFPPPAEPHIFLNNQHRPKRIPLTICRIQNIMPWVLFYSLMTIVIKQMTMFNVRLITLILSFQGFSASAITQTRNNGSRIPNTPCLKQIMSL